MIRTRAVRLFAALLAAGSVLVPAAASSADPVLPGAPTEFHYVAETADTVTWGWSPPSAGADAVTGYALQSSTDDGETWSTVPGTESTALEGTAPLPTTGHLIWYRAVAFTADGSGPGSDALCSLRPGNAPQRFLIRDERGQPLSGGPYRWSDGYGTWSADGWLGPDGIIDLPSVPAGTGMLLEIGDAYFANGTSVNKTFSVDMGTDPQTLVVPDPPPMESHAVKVVLPGGVPVPDAEVDARTTDGLMDVVERDGFTYGNTDVLWDARTDADGMAVVRGWSAEGVDFEPPSKYPWPEQAIDVVYEGTDLHDERIADLGDGVTTVQLSPVPWTTTGPSPDPTTAGDMTSLAFTVHPAATGARTTAAVAATKAQVTLRPPAGWSAKRCAGRSRLTGTPDAHGRVHLRVCASRSGAVRVSVRGAVATAPVTVRVRRAAPLPPAHVAVANGKPGQLTVSWTRPAYTGGAAVTAYRVRLMAHGQATRTYVLRSSAGLHHVFSGLKRATPWRASVAAINRYGTGNPATSRWARVI